MENEAVKKLKEKLLEAKKDIMTWLAIVDSTYGDFWSADRYMGYSVYFAMSEEQKERERRVDRFVSQPLTGSGYAYLKFDQVPDFLCIDKVIGKERSLCVLKLNLPKVVDILCPCGVTWDVESMIEKIEKDRVWIIGISY